MSCFVLFLFVQLFFQSADHDAPSGCVQLAMFSHVYRHDVAEFLSSCDSTVLYAVSSLDQLFQSRKRVLTDRVGPVSESRAERGLDKR